MRSASISVFEVHGKERAAINVHWDSMNPIDVSYAFNGLTAAKRYFGRHYQSVRWGFETPVWIPK